jgi:hypothetical protein
LERDSKHDLRKYGTVSVWNGRICAETPVTHLCAQSFGCLEDAKSFLVAAWPEECKMLVITAANSIYKGHLGALAAKWGGQL